MAQEFFQKATVQAALAASAGAIIAAVIMAGFPQWSWRQATARTEFDLVDLQYHRHPEEGGYKLAIKIQNTGTKKVYINNVRLVLTFEQVLKEIGEWVDPQAVGEFYRRAPDHSAHLDRLVDKLSLDQWKIFVFYAARHPCFTIAYSPANDTLKDMVNSIVPSDQRLPGTAYVYFRTADGMEGEKDFPLVGLLHLKDSPECEEYQMPKTLPPESPTAP